MTTTPNCTRTTTLIRQGASTPLLISYDFTGMETLMPDQRTYLLLIDQAIKQWWDLLTNCQKSAFKERPLSLKISAHCQKKD